MSFHWAPRALFGKTSGCLTYSIMLPADFEAQQGGLLPGLMGAQSAGPSTESFTTRLMWNSDGDGAIGNRVITNGEIRVAAAPAADKSGTLQTLQSLQTSKLDAEPETFTLPRGRWTRLEQEIILNTPKQPNGILRVWVDGKLAVERTDLVFRMDGTVSLSGVAADVFYMGDDVYGASPKDATVLMAPFAIRW